jgi:hypothetical protein
MSQTLLKFLLSELKTFRIVCRGKPDGKTVCGAVLEVSRERLATTFKPKECKCPVCGEPFHTYEPAGNTRNPFAALAEALARTDSIEDRMVVELVLPVPPEKTAER